MLIRIETFRLCVFLGTYFTETYFSLYKIINKDNLSLMRFVVIIKQSYVENCNVRQFNLLVLNNSLIGVYNEKVVCIK